MPGRTRLKGISAYLPKCFRAPGPDTHEFKGEVLVVLGVRSSTAPGYPAKISWLSSAMSQRAIGPERKKETDAWASGSVLFPKDRGEGLNEDRANRSQLSLGRSRDM